MREGIQSFFDSAGDASCYALDIIQIASEEAGKNLDAEACLWLGIDRGYIFYDENDPHHPDNFFVKYPAEFLTVLTMEPWTVEKVGADYREKQGERIVERWEYYPTGKTIGHFRLPHWDSLKDSKTVKYGTIVSKRVFRKKRGNNA